MKGTTVRNLAILEPLLVYAMILAYIWNWRYTHGAAWVAILGLMLLSHLVRRESAYSLGFRTRHMRECWREIAPALAFLTLLMLASGILLGPSGSGPRRPHWPPTCRGECSSSTPSTAIF
jgi:hypothetical protein